MSGFHLDFARSTPPVATSATLRNALEDFEVDEELGFEPSGAGEHVLIRLRKRGLNTDDVARRIGSAAGVPRRAVSWSGLKDRHGCTTQWFSVHLPGKPADDERSRWAVLEDDTLQILEVARHERKLRVGTHRGNGFRIRVRDVDVPDADVDAACERIAGAGVPNYFGEQRFGHGGSNLARAREVLSAPRRKKHDFRRGMHLSALRGWIFNLYLESRVADGTWVTCVAGDALQFEGSGSWYVQDLPDAESDERLSSGDAHVSGPLWGAGDPPVRDVALSRELALRDSHREWCELLEGAGLRQERRALRVMPRALAWERDADASLVFSFSLPRGAYATSVLRELVSYRDVTRERGES